MKTSIKTISACAALVAAMAIALPAAAQTPISCPDFGYAKLGGENDATEVSNLQTFLKTSEGLDVDVNGRFDGKTEIAVEAFQRKYMNDVMGPWGATRPSGVVNLTTVKKIEQILCGKPLMLDEGELSSILAYNEGNIQSGEATLVATAGVDGSNLILGPDAALNPEDMPAATAAVGDSAGASLWSRFTSFVRNIFR